MVVDQSFVQEALQKVELLSHDVVVSTISSLKSSECSQWFEANVWNVQEYLESLEWASLAAIDGALRYLKNATLFQL